MAAASYIEVHAHLKIGSKCTHPELWRITIVLIVENAFNSLPCMHVKMTPSHNLLLCCVAKYLTNPLVNLGGCRLQPLQYGINGRCTVERGVDEVYCCKTFEVWKLERNRCSRLCYLHDCCQLTGEFSISSGGASAFGKRAAFRGQGSCSGNTTVHTSKSGGPVWAAGETSDKNYKCQRLQLRHCRSGHVWKLSELSKHPLVFMLFFRQSFCRMTDKRQSW